MHSLTFFSYRIVLYALSFSIPLFFSSQIITGILVNCFLFLSAQKLSFKQILPVIILPSLGALAHNTLFGPQTIFLYYFLPVIWIGNGMLVTFFSKIQTGIVGKIILSAIVKYLILHFFAQLYFRSNIVPSLFISSMGYIQLITALVGGIIAYGITIMPIYERINHSH